MELALLTTLQRELQDTKGAENGFKRTSFEKARLAVEQASTLRVQLSYTQCRSKYDSFKRDWKAWVELNKQSGFSVDENGVVTGDPEALEYYYERHAEARKFRNKPIKYENILYELFEGTIATGEEAVGATDEQDSSSDSVPESSTQVQSSAEIVGDIDGDTIEDTASSMADGESRVTARAGLVARDSRPRQKKPLTGGAQIIKSIDVLGEKLTALSKPNWQLLAIQSLTNDFAILGDSLRCFLIPAFKDEFIALAFASVSNPMKKILLRQQLVEMRDKLSLAGFDVDEILGGYLWEGEGPLVRAPGRG